MKKKHSSVCALVSGGLDSVALMAHLSETYSSIQPVYVRQGLTWERVEIHWLRRLLKALRSTKIIKPMQIFELPMKDVYGRHWSLGHRSVPGPRTRDEAVYLPGRNPLLTIKPAIFCAREGIAEMAMGSLDHNPFPDATPAFFKLWSKALTQALGQPLRLRAPFRLWSKADVIRRYQQWPLALSFSCLDPQGFSHCGRCNKCAERRGAFKKADVLDQTSYVH